jgi:hypothetical protein
MYMETKRGHIRECVQVAIGRRWIVVDLDGGDGLRRLLLPARFSQARLLSATMWGSSTGQALDFSHFLSY